MLIERHLYRVETEWQETEPPHRMQRSCHMVAVREPDIGYAALMAVAWVRQSELPLGGHVKCISAERRGAVVVPEKNADPYPRRAGAGSDAMGFGWLLTCPSCRVPGSGDRGRGTTWTRIGSGKNWRWSAKC